MKRRNHPNPKLRFGRYPKDIEQRTPYYGFMRQVTRMLFEMIWKVRYFDRHNEPDTGGVVYLSNHQSFFDPMLVTMGLVRPGNYMARDTLFNNYLFGKLLSSLHTFPIKRGSADLGALKEAMRRLKNNHTVVIFPEGTRTPDGRIGEFLPGVAMLAQRAAEWVVPVVVDGAYELWPKEQTLPSLSECCFVKYGTPIHRDDIKKMKSDVFLADVRQRMIKMQHELRERIGRQPFDYGK